MARDPKAKLRANQRWRLKNPDKVRAYAREAMRKLRLADPHGTRAKLRMWQKNNPEKVRDYGLRARFGLTLAEWEQLFARQNHQCAICTERTPRGPWQTDHNHCTGRIRGILCRQCNHMLGMARDNPAHLLAAAAYLTR